MKNLLNVLMLFVLTCAMWSQSKVPTISGSPTNGNCAQWGAGGAIADAGAVCGSGGGTITLTAFYDNDTVTGTTNFVPAKWKSYSINEKKILKTDATDLGGGWFLNIVGIVQSGGGTSGQAVVAYAGRATCQFDNTANAGEFVTIGATGLCTAVSGAGVNEDPQINKYFAKVHTSIGAPGNTDIDLIPVGAYSLANCCGANGTAARYQLSTPGSPFLSNGNLFVDTSSPGTSGSPMTATNVGFTIYSVANLSKGAKLTGEYGTILTDGTHLDGLALRLDTDTGMAPQFGYMITAACVQGTDCKNADGTAGNSAAFLTPPDVSSISATPSVIDTLADSHLWTMTGNWASFGLTTIKPGHVTRWTIKQDGTGGRTMVWPTSFINAPAVSLVAGDTTTADFWAADSTHVYCIGGCTGPIRVVKTSQVAAISTTNIAKPQADSTYRVTATLDCDSASAAATVNVTIGWTDPSNTAQTATLGSAVVCTTLGSASIGTLTTAFRVKANTNISYATSIVNTPTYDAVVALETLTSN